MLLHPDVNFLNLDLFHFSAVARPPKSVKLGGPVK